MKQVAPHLVNYLPDPKKANERIVALNEMTQHFTAQDIATRMASEVAAYAFVLLETNTLQRVQELFIALACDAHMQREARKDALQKQELDEAAIRQAH